MANGKVTIQTIQRDIKTCADRSAVQLARINEMIAEGRDNVGDLVPGMASVKDNADQALKGIHHYTKGKP